MKHWPQDELGSIFDINKRGQTKGDQTKGDRFIFPKRCGASSSVV